MKNKVDDDESRTQMVRDEMWGLGSAAATATRKGTGLGWLAGYGYGYGYGSMDWYGQWPLYGFIGVLEYGSGGLALLKLPVVQGYGSV